MAAVISRLELVWRTRSGGGGRTERQYLDFVVDEQSLGDLLDVGDNVGCLGWGLSQYDEDTVQVLLRKKPSPLHTGRVMLYICAECGDIGCGAGTVDVQKTAEHFLWQSFGWENDTNMPNLKPFQNIGPFRFNKTEYYHTLMDRPKL